MLGRCVGEWRGRRSDRFGRWEVGRRNSGMCVCLGVGVF